MLHSTGVSTRVNRHGSIVIDRQPALAPHHQQQVPNDTWEIQPTPTAEPSTTFDLRQSGAQFEQRQLELDYELERLSQQLANATPPRDTPQMQGPQQPFQYTSTASPPQQAQPRQHQAVGRLLQQSTQRHYNWRSPGPFALSEREETLRYGDTSPAAPAPAPPLPPTAAATPTNGISARVSRRGSIVIERTQPPPPQSSYPPPHVPLPSQVDAAIEQEHQAIVNHMQQQMQQLHAQCMELKHDNAEVMNELNVFRAQSTHLMSEMSQKSLEDQAKAFALVRSKDNELILLRDQQDRTMKLLSTCTQQRDLLVDDNRLLRQELDDLLRRFNYNGGSGDMNEHRSQKGGGTLVAAAAAANVQAAAVVPVAPHPAVPSISLSQMYSSSPRQSSPPKSKIFVSSNRRSSRVNSSESSWQVINARTSAGDFHKTQ